MFEWYTKNIVYLLFCFNKNTSVDQNKILVTKMDHSSERSCKFEVCSSLFLSSNGCKE